MSHADRILAAVPHVWPLYVAFVLFLGAAYLVARVVDVVTGRVESDLMAPWKRAEREPGDLS